jgi:hypothetical protein
MVHWMREGEMEKSNHGQLDQRAGWRNRTMVHWMREGEMEKSNHGQLDDRWQDGEL